MKRIFDLVLASFGIVFFSLPAIFFFVIIKLEDGGPIFYFQERWGEGGGKFKAYKFRTMVTNADRKWGVKPAQENDSRITCVGKFLRATAMDELPQLINIWKGDMSFVGPRALAVKEISPFLPNFLERHKIKPGLTGPAQIFASRDAALEDKFHYDLEYIEKWNFFTDLKLIFLSVWITTRGKWESRQKKI